MTLRLITVNDLYAFDPSVQVSLEEFTDVVGRNFKPQPFIVQVTLNIKASGSTAHIVLSGAGASGERDYTVIPPFQGLSRQFGALRVWQGFPHTGAFDATNIAVTRKTD